MKRLLKWAGAFLAGAIIAGAVGAYAYQTNYLGVIFISDAVDLTKQATVSACGGPPWCLNVSIGGSTTVPVKPGTVTLTDRSGTIGTGGTSQQVMASNASRLFIRIQNPCSENESLFVNYGAAASGTSASEEITPCGSVTWDGTSITTQAINVVAATTSHRFVAKEGQ